MISDNLSCHKSNTARRWAQRNNVELCFTPTYSSWANPSECHFGPLREFVLNHSDYPNHTVLRRPVHNCLRWRNDNARAPECSQRCVVNGPGSVPNSNAGGARPRSRAA